MFIPSTVIRLLQNIDITNDYINTFSFINESTQSSFFISKTKSGCLFTDFVYQRKEKTVKIPINIETLWNISYMMFQNTDFGSKWFYAYITDMKFINDETTEISFEIDVMQTWYFNVDIKDCYIEREHVDNDAIGEHRVDENLDVGNYVIKSSETIAEIQDLAIIISTTVDSSDNDVLGELFTGVYSGNAYYASSDYNFINAFITLLEGFGKADAINNIFMMPSGLIENFEAPIRVSAPNPVIINKSFSKNLTNLDGYVPKNNKLFTYPYNFLAINNNRGETSIYKYELSNSSSMDFFISSNVAPAPTVYLVPKNYNGLTNNYDEFITLSGYPMCNWTTDIYNNWISQNIVSNSVSVGTSILGLGVGFVTGNPIAVAGGAIGVATSIGAFYEKSLQPNPIKGAISGGGNLAIGIQNFIIYKKTIRSEYANMIDKFFDRFGYKINQLKTPNFSSRLNWNFIKMHEVNIFGNIPNNDLKKIHQIYKNGITFWHNDNVGNYNRVNTII